MKKISDRALDEIRGKIDIVDIINEHVTLKHKGREHWGLCPFHDEKTPSFTVNPDKGVFFCHGCRAGGDAITFLIEHTRQSFAEVATDLARKYGVELGETEEDIRQWQEENKLKRDLIAINETACNFFQSKLELKAIEYLRHRGISDDSILQFRLGHAPDDWNDLLNLLLSKYEFDLVIQSGLVTQKGDSIYNSFRDRLMMPIFDPQGQVIGFSGRSLGDGKPKYLNSPETILFKKSEILYPFHLARKAIADQNSTIVCEGNFDVIRLHQSGMCNAIASLGTSLSSRQINKLVRQTKDNNLILAFDNDQAGDKAVLRVIKDNLKTINQMINLKVLRLPKAFKDIDEILSTPNGKMVIPQLIAKAQVWVDWKIELALAAHDLEDSTAFNLCSKEFVEILNQVYDPNLKTFFVEKCAKLLARDNHELIPNHRQALQTKTKIRFNQTNQTKRTDINIYKNLSEKDTRILSREMSLAKIALFNPTEGVSIFNSLASIGYSFIKDPICRWILNQIYAAEKIDEYLAPNLKIELDRILSDQSVFEDTAEFLNSNFALKKLLQEKQRRLFDHSDSSVLSVVNYESQLLDIYKDLKSIKIDDRIGIIEMYLKNEADEAVQWQYLQEVLELKKQQINQ